MRSISYSSFPRHRVQLVEWGEEKKNKKWIVYCKYWSYLMCCPLWVMWCVCCRKKAKEDPFDDGQNVYGVNYKEYLAWKNGEDIGDRKLPKKYQNLSFHNAARKAKKINEDVNE